MCIPSCSATGYPSATQSTALKALLHHGEFQIAWACRLLFCNTEDGKASMVRQLSPDVHVDTSRRSVLALQRFTRRLVLLQLQAPTDPELLQNVSVVPSLSAALGD
jgi:hypothetical protein